jgi:hypothetical protein
MLLGGGSGGQLTRRPHLLSQDGRLLLVCVAGSLRAYSATTGELLFSILAHDEELSCLAADPSAPSQVQ